MHHCLQENQKQMCSFGTLELQLLSFLDSRSLLCKLLYQRRVCQVLFWRSMSAIDLFQPTSSLAKQPSKSQLSIQSKRMLLLEEQTSYQLDSFYHSTPCIAFNGKQDQYLNHTQADLLATIH